MTSFALITEGITDQAVITSILYGFYDDDEPDIRPMQPCRDQTDNSRQGDFAGWEKVLDYCGLEHFEQLFSVNDYAIIHLETDVAEHPNFGISLHVEGAEKKIEILIEEVKQLLIKKISNEIFKKYEDRIIFCICVHSIECWILSLHMEGKQTQRTKSCYDHLSRLLQKKDIHLNKNYRCYENISKNFERKKYIESACEKNLSLKIFTKSLPQVAKLA